MRLLALLFLWAFLAQQVQSCDCQYVQSHELSNIEHEIDQSDWIGLISITEKNNQTYLIQYSVKTQIVFKGSEKIKSVRTGKGGADCGFEFEVGEQYLVYGNLSDEFTASTNRCRRTNKIKASADYDYLIKTFKDKNRPLNWSESFTNYVRGKTGEKINIENPPLIIGEDFQILSVEKLIGKHPNYYTMEFLHFSASDLEGMNPDLRNKVVTAGLLIVKSPGVEVRKSTLIKALNQY